MDQERRTVPVITYEQAVAEFSHPAALARALGVKRASVSEWKKAGFVPEGRVWQLIVLRPDAFSHLLPDATPQMALPLASGVPDG